MEADMLHAAGQALLIILDPMRLAYLFAGVCMGLALGILPGIGGVAGLALLLPFTYNMDAPAAFALLLGMGSTTGTADPISAILFGAPGHAASAATVLDGYPMTKRGEAGRALGASYLSAMIGGIFGAALMGVSIPILRPIILYLGLAGVARDFGVRRLDGVHAVRQRATARRLYRLFRHDAVDDRHRSPVGNAALDHGLALSVGRDAAGAAHARHLRAARAMRSRDRRGRRSSRPARRSTPRAACCSA